MKPQTRDPEGTEVDLLETTTPEKSDPMTFCERAKREDCGGLREKTSGEFWAAKRTLTSCWVLFGVREGTGWEEANVAF